MTPTFEDAVKCATHWVAKVCPHLDEAEVAEHAMALATKKVEASRGAGTIPDYAHAMFSIQDWGFDHLSDHTPFFYH